MSDVSFMEATLLQGSGVCRYVLGLEKFTETVQVNRASPQSARGYKNPALRSKHRHRVGDNDCSAER
jgi:hypothetical protein